MTKPVAAAIALAYGLVMLAVLGSRSRRPAWLLAAGAAGAVVFSLTVLLVNPIQSLVASVAGWNADAFNTSLGAGLAGIVIAAAVNEIFTLAAALLVWSRAQDAEDGVFAFGGAVGAGFGTVGAFQVVTLALSALSLPVGSTLGFVTSLAQQLAFVGVHAAATAIAALGVQRQRLGVFLLAAVAADAVFAALGLLFSLQAYSSLVWTGLAVILAGALVAGAIWLDREQTAVPASPGA